MPDITYADALNQALREEMQRDPTVFVMGEDVAVWGDRGGVFGVTDQCCPRRRDPTLAA